MNSSHEHFDTARLNAIPITEVARRLGDTLRRTGTVWKTYCPWHDDEHPSLTFYERTGENHCHCFSCGKGGSPIDYVMQHEQLTFQQACQWLSIEFGICSQPLGGPVPTPRRKPVEKRPPIDYTYIPMEMVDELVSTENSLCLCLKRLFQPEAVDWIAEEYKLGSYTLGDDDDYTVFPNIDVQGRVCNLKVQRYDTDPSSPRFAHSQHGSCRWLGTMWAREGRLPLESQFRSSCLFGEHLLVRYQSPLVALVESPKNALFGALAFPQMVWVATGNKNALKREVLRPLRGRDVIVLPDCDAVEEWTKLIAGMTDLANFTVSDFCQRHAPEGQPKFDIADYLQQQHSILRTDHPF